MRRLFARAVAAGVMVYARFCVRTSRLEGLRETVARLERSWDPATPAVYVYWHDEFVSNVLLPIHWHALGASHELPACGANDAFGGDVIQACLSRLGVPLALLPRQLDRFTKLKTLADALRAHRRLLLAADYGRPWFRARPTAFQLARETGGVVVAMHLHAVRPWVVSWRGWKLMVPRPFTRYELRLQRVDVDLTLDDHVLVAPLDEALDSLRVSTPTSDVAGASSRGLDMPSAP